MRVHFVDFTLDHLLGAPTALIMALAVPTAPQVEEAGLEDSRIATADLHEQHGRSGGSPEPTHPGVAHWNVRILIRVTIGYLQV
jgi:hypothetical protein